MNDFNFSPLNFDPVQDTAHEIVDTVRECEPPYLMFEAGLISQPDLETAINVSYFARMSAGRALVMHSVVQQSTLDLAIDLSYLLRNKRILRVKAIEMLRFERELIKLEQVKEGNVVLNSKPLQNLDPPLIPLKNPLMKALQGAYSKNSVFYSV